MKSFVTYPLEFQTILFPSKLPASPSGKQTAHYEIFKRISHLSGSIVKCGITAEEGFTRFSLFKKLAGRTFEQKMIAFEKLNPLFEEEIDEYGTATLKVKDSKISAKYINETLRKKGSDEKIDFVPGAVCESIPEYIIENPELKIALLNIDTDDYNATMTSLEFLYPRLMPQGILIVDNYYKRLSEFEAINSFFYPRTIQINNFSSGFGPHYIIKN